MKVAKIIDPYTLVITKKDGPWLSRGDILVIGTQMITDPETGEDIGILPGLRVKIAEVYEKFVVADVGLDCQPNVEVNVGDTVYSWDSVRQAAVVLNGH